MITSVMRGPYQRKPRNRHEAFCNPKVFAMNREIKASFAIYIYIYIFFFLPYLSSIHEKAMYRYVFER